MSSDEIRKLAQLPSVQFGGYYSPAEKNMIRAALIAYAAMVERCEDLIARLPYPPNGNDVWLSRKLNYILRGDTGKEAV